GTWAHDVFAVGTAAMAVEVAIVVMVFGRHRLAPLFAAVAGASLAAGYVLVHFTPARGWLSDSLLSTSHVVSIAAAGLETTAAIVTGAVGADIFWRLRAQGSGAGGAERRHSVDWRRAISHPAV